MGTTQPLQVVMAGSHVFAEWAGKRVVRRIVSQDIGVSFHAAPRTRPGSCPAPRPHAPSSQDGRAGRPLCRRMVTVWLVPSRCSCEGRSGRGLRPERQTRGVSGGASKARTLSEASSRRRPPRAFRPDFRGPLFSDQERRTCLIRASGPRPNSSILCFAAFRQARVTEAQVRHAVIGGSERRSPALRFAHMRVPAVPVLDDSFVLPPTWVAPFLWRRSATRICPASHPSGRSDSAREGAPHPDGRRMVCEEPAAAGS